ncbi:hypothetical protein [Paenibacillus physcomitrellae]|uniref:Uncharacterized protein n=1 Tax=Paenibacillus physcomitrellae TaxID=1619311 RepID=A0ABQ1GC30_9BACL|nr:hypothetical protein [Paenibacillus physcomitrellae]GGA40833.1 hypothetical protein GCM10010917_27610 [Paenibacillus physcomitrellae]
MLRWSPIENAKIIGVLPEYRDLIKNGGYTASKASNVIANQLLKDDTAGVFSKRTRNVKHILHTLEQHIQRMDGIAAGSLKPIHAEEPNWAGCFPYPY